MHCRPLLFALGLPLPGLWLAPAAAPAQDFTDSAGRSVDLPAAIERVLPAGPPAAVLLYALAPEKMVGWVAAPSPEAQEFIAAPFRNVRLVELPRGDWAFTMTRQYLFDVFDLVRLAQLTNSAYQPLAEVAAKVRPEELYHYRHTHTWVKRLGLGTAESNQRMQAALNELWPYAQQLFQPTPGEHLLVEAGYVPDPAGLHTAWTETVVPFLRQCDLVVPDSPAAEQDGRDVHTPHLEQLVNELQEVARLDPQAQW